MHTEPVWIREDAVLAIHRRQLAEHGGLEGVRDAGLLSSALYRPQQLFTYVAPSLSELAASYAFGIARNHPFLDGNKRTALAVADTFLLLNGHEIIAAPTEVYNAVIALASGVSDEAAFAAWVASVVPKV
jgi:death-on-curing protein